MSSILRSLRPLRTELKKNVQAAPELRTDFVSRQERDDFIDELELFLATIKTRRGNFFHLHEELVKIEGASDADKKALEAQVDQDAAFLLELDTCIDLTSVQLRRLLKVQEREIGQANIDRQAQAQAQIQAELVLGHAPAQNAPVPVAVQAPPRVKLPKIEIELFDGDITKYKEFWDAFDAAVHRNASIARVDKFNYLRSFLIGDAKTAISGLALTNENYDVAVMILAERFGNDQLIIQAHYAAITNLPPAKNETYNIRATVDILEKNFRSLERMNQQVNQNAYFISVIIAKLPKGFITRLEESRGADPWTVETLRRKVQQFLAAREVAEQQYQTASKDQRASKDQTNGKNGYAKANSGGGKNSGSHNTTSSFFLGEKNSPKGKKLTNILKAFHWI